jgi:hypothetical protein
MGEVIGAIAEAFLALITAIIQLMPVVIEALTYLVIGAVVVVRYGFSRTYRERKDKEWAAKPRLKFLQLGGGGLCLAALIAAGVYTTWAMTLREPKHDLARVEAAKKEDLRVSLETGSNRVTIAIKEGGLSNILATRTMKELSTALSENVVTVKTAPPTNPPAHSP